MKDPYKRREELHERISLNEDGTFKHPITTEEFLEIQREINSATFQIETESNIGTKGYKSDKNQTSSINKGGNKARMRQ